MIIATSIMAGVVCSGEIIESLLDSDIKPTIFFSNDNIDRVEEYQTRKKSIESFARKRDLDIIDDPYQSSDWQSFIKGLEHEPEGGQRCEQCFIFRLNKAAQCAFNHGLRVFTSTLGISRHKNLDLVNACGRKVAEQYPQLIYWDHNWRKKGGSERMYIIAKKEQFYSQKYCGCVYSLRNEEENDQENISHC